MLPGLAWTVIGQWVYLIVAALLIAHRRYFVSHTFLYGIPSIRNVFLCAPWEGVRLTSANHRRAWV